MKKYFLLIFLMFFLGCQTTTGDDKNETLETNSNSNNSNSTVKIKFPPQPPQIENS